MLSLKPGVRILGLTSQIVLAATIVASVYQKHNRDCVITVSIEGGHMSGSEHYVGNALDFRLNDVMPSTLRSVIVADVKTALGEDFDVLHEDPASDNEHLHVEYDPKRSYS